MTKGGIVLPDIAHGAPDRGKVIAVGCGALSQSGTIVEPQTAVGDSVVFIPFSDTSVTIEVDGQERFVISEKDILAVIAPEV